MRAGYCFLIWKSLKTIEYGVISWHFSNQAAAVSKGVDLCRWCEVEEATRERQWSSLVITCKVQCRNSVCIPDGWYFYITSTTCDTVAEPRSAHWTISDPIHLEEACSPLPTFTAYLASLTNFLSISCAANEVNTARTVGIAFVVFRLVGILLSSVLVMLKDWSQVSMRWLCYIAL